MICHIIDLLTKEDLDYLVNHPKVQEAELKINSKISGSVYFDIELTESIKNTLKQK